MAIIIIFGVILALFLPLFLYDLYKKKRTLRMLTEKYGKPSSRMYDERDFKNIGQLFNLFPIKRKETVDDITWNDIQMPILYRHMNHSVSHIGDEYLYRHIRTQQYDELERLERHIQYFDTHPEERLKLQYAFNNINPRAKTENHFVAHLKDRELIPKISKIYIILSLIFMFLNIISTLLFVHFLLKDEVTVVFMFLAFAFSFMGAVYTVMYLIKRIQKIIPTIRTFNACIQASRQIATLDSHIFDRELKALLPALKKLEREAGLMDLYVGICLLQNPTLYMLSSLTTYFGLAGICYPWVAKTIKNNAKEAMTLYECIGYIELCIGLSSYRKTLSYYCLPEFSRDTQLVFEDLYHPLLQDPVTNSKTIDQKSIITGANASGKSTFAKTLAINALAAQNINICYAKKFSLQPACIYTTMDLSDDITKGDSFYMAEIKRLKDFLESLSKDSYSMFFADELLKGTNTLERIAAASAILWRFAENDCFFCLTTHDTELTGILHYYYSNYHFQETTTDSEIHYDYKLYDGVTTGSNAIALLQVMQYDSSIVDKASKSAQYYKNSGEWEILKPCGQVTL
jgi:hypothetical protein